jgi:hypothetical protein
VTDSRPPARSAFYDAALGAQSAYVRVFSGGPISAGWGTPDGDRAVPPSKLQARPPSAGPARTSAFAAPKEPGGGRRTVFHREALRHGAVDDGGPGERPEFGPTY